MGYREAFKYSGSKTDFDSSAVEEAYYNVDSKELAIVLTSGSGYIYSNVPSYVWNSFVNAASAGRYYAETIKQDYGPGEYVGYMNEEDEFFENIFDEDTDYDFEEAEDNREDSLMDTGDNLIDASRMFKQSPPVTQDNLITFPDFGNTEAAPTTVNIFNNTSQTFSLAPEDKVATRKHILNFRVDGQTVIRTHTVQAVNLEDAIAKLREVADMLDLVFEVTSATVVFSE